MAINFTTDILTVNEDDALNAGTDETTQLAFDTALPAISAYLATQTAGTDGDIQTPEVASQANFVNLAFTGGSSLTALTFASDANGTDFSTTVGVGSGLDTIAGDSILLYAVAGFPNLLVGRTGGATGPVSFAIALQDTANGHYTGWVIDYEAQYHNGPDKIGALDFNTLANKIFLSADSIAPLLFSDFTDVPSSNPLFAMIGPDSAGPDGQGATQILVTSFDPDGAFDTVNISTQSGNPGSLGSGSQSVGQNAGLRLDFVTGGNTTYTNGNDINNLTYTAHNETIKDAGFSLVQTNPDKASLDITVSAFNSNNNDQQALFRTATSVNDASVVNITGVLVKDAAGQVIEDTRAGGTDSPLIGVTGLGTGTTTITGLLDDYTVEVFSASNFDRLTIKNVDPDSNNSFDVGKLFYTRLVSNTDNTEIGSKIELQDDGPTISSSIAGAHTAQVDETNLVAAGISATADLTSNFSVDYGSDEAGSSSFKLGVKTAGVDSGLVDIATGDKVLLYSVDDTHVEGRNTGGMVVVSFVLADAAKAEVTFTQFRAVEHLDDSSSDDVTPALAADILTFTGTAVDADLDHTQSSTLNIGGLFSIRDDGPTIKTDGAASALHVDESFIPGIGSLDATGAFDTNTATGSFAGIFSNSTYGADGAGSVSGFALGIKSDGAETGLLDSATGDKVVLRIHATTGVVTGETLGSGADVFTVSVATNGQVTLTLLRGVIHGIAEIGDGSEPASSLAADLITLSATVQDKEGDTSTGSASIGDKFVFHDDGPTVGVRHAFEVDFTADAVAADHVIGNIGGVGGADTTASVKLTTYTDLAGFFEEKVGDNTVIYHKGTDATGDAFFKFTVDGNGNYDFTVLKSGSATNESFNFGSVKPGAPIETVTVKSQFGHAIGVFDGVIFNGAGANNYVNSPTKNVDDINTDKLGFGIVGNNPNQASQINNNEGFTVLLDQASDTFQFDMQGIGNNAKGVHVEYTAWNDTNNDGKVNGAETIVITGTAQKAINSGNSLTNFKIDGLTDFDAVNVRFYFEGGTNGDLQNGALSGNPLRQAIDNAGIRILNFGVKQVDTIPEYDMKFGVTRTDKDGDSATTSVGVHVDPDHIGVPTDITNSFNWLIV